MDSEHSHTVTAKIVITKERQIPEFNDHFIATEDEEVINYGGNHGAK